MLSGHVYHVADDYLPPVQMLGDVPGYALDQFTRVGNTVTRALLTTDPELRQWARDTGIPAGSQPRALGDLLFLVEGGLIIKRARWPLSDWLRSPWRCLGSIAMFQGQIGMGLKYIQQKACQVAQLRSTYFPPGG